MFDFGFHLFCVFAVLAIVQVKQISALKYGCGSFARDMTYSGTVPSDKNIFIKSLAGLDKIQCFQNCHFERSCCVGVLYNREEMECTLLKHHLTESGRDGNISNGEWGYFKITACGKSWQPYCGYCYIYIELHMTWQAAHEHCQYLGSHLVDVRSQDEYIWIRNMTSSAIWLGGNDMDNEGQFVWSSDKSALMYTNWDEGEPNDAFNNVDCIADHDSSWNDEACSNPRQFLCKKPMYI